MGESFFNVGLIYMKVFFVTKSACLDPTVPLFLFIWNWYSLFQLSILHYLFFQFILLTQYFNFFLLNFLNYILFHPRHNRIHFWFPLCIILLSDRRLRWQYQKLLFKLFWKQAFHVMSFANCSSFTFLRCVLLHF